MGKDKKKNKLPKGGSIDPAGLSKKERKQLERRAAELEAALKAAKKAKKAKKKHKVASAAADAPKPLTKEERDAKAPKTEKAPVEKPETDDAPALGKTGLETHGAAAVIEAADKVLADPNAPDEVKAHARKMRGKALETMTPEDLKARVASKKERRTALEASAKDIDRDDVDAVRAYNAELADLGGTRFITSNAELAKEHDRIAGAPEPIGDEVEKRDEVKTVATAESIAAVKASKRAKTSTPTPVGDDVEAAERAALEKAKSKKRKAKADELVVEVDGEAFAKPSEQTVEEVETDRGRVFAAGEASDGTDAPGEAFAKPSEAPLTDFAENGNHQYIVKRPSDGKLVGYTRATTYINNLESTDALTKWKMRMLLEGVAVADAPEDGKGASDPVVARVRELIHVRDMAIAKARKADRKGKLEVGQLGGIVDGAWRDFKKALNALADELLELGGANEKREKGTDIHALCELYDREGIDAVGELLTEGKITPADLADVEAYARALDKAGIKVVTEHIEQVVVNHELKVAGRLDRVFMVKLPGAQRAVRVVGDIKTGAMADYALGKTAQQVELYSSCEGYDLNTHETVDLKVSKTKGVLVHLPAGSGECRIHVIDLGLGRRGNKLSGEVRAWRNEGKRAIDMKVDLANLPTEAASA